MLRQGGRLTPLPVGTNRTASCLTRARNMPEPAVPATPLRNKNRN